MSKRSNTRLALFLLFLLALIVTSRSVYHDGQQQKLNSALFSAIKMRDLASVGARLAEGADVNARDLPVDSRNVWWRLWDRLSGKPLLTGNMPTALMVAQSNHDTQTVSGEKIPVVNALLDAGAEINARDNDGSTALYYAIDASDTSLVQLLLARGAQIKVRNSAGKTPLHMASYPGRSEMAVLLIQHGSDVNARDDDGDTPLFLAVLFNDATCVERLLARGAQVNIKDIGEFTPLTFAQENQNAPIITLLKKAGATE